MLTVYAKLKGHELSLVSSPTLASDSNLFDIVNFEFDEHWDGFFKTALFWGAGDETPYPSVVDENGNATIPSEVLAERSTIRFGVFGESEDLSTVITSTILKYKIQEGAWSDSEIADEDVTQSLVEQLKMAAYAAVINATRAAELAQQASTEAAVAAQNASAASDDADSSAANASSAGASASAAEASAAATAEASIAAKIAAESALTNLNELGTSLTSNYADIVAEVNRFISVTEASVAGIVGKPPDVARKTIWEAEAANSLIAEGDSITLTDDLTEYDYVEFSVYNNGKRESFRFEPSFPIKISSAAIRPSTTAASGSYLELSVFDIYLNFGNGALSVTKCYGIVVDTGQYAYHTYNASNRTTNTLFRVDKIVGWKYSASATDTSLKDTELVDIRTGYDGTAYLSAGSAVRGQIGDMKDYVDDATDVFNNTIESVKKHTIGFRSSARVPAGYSVIDDAVPGLEPIAAPLGTQIYSRNMFSANITGRISNGVTFTADPDDPNTITLDGTATGNAYSYGSINASNAAALLEPGIYYIRGYANTDEAYPILYADLIDFESGTKTQLGTSGNIGSMNGFFLLNLASKSYLGVRVQLANGLTVSNLTVHVYISSVLPDIEYVPYAAPDGLFHGRSVVLAPESGYIEYYKNHALPAAPVRLKLATFNCGEFDHGNTDYPDTPEDFDAYARYIAGLDADVLFTQEDRVYKSVANEITTWDALYKYMFSHGGIVSNSTSTHGMMAKGIYSNYPLYVPRKKTFTAQAGWSSLTAYLASFNGRVVLLLSAHLAAHEENASTRAAQIAEIMEYIEETNPEYCIICGDFNTWSASELDGFGEYIKANAGPFGGFVTFHAGDHIFDNIIVSPNIKLLNVHIVENDLDDHYALVADVILD